MPPRLNRTLHQDELAQNAGKLGVALHELRAALRRLDDRAHAPPRRARDDVLLAALADANRALAEVQRLAGERGVLLSARCADCPRCRGDGGVTERGALLRRVPCPDCGGAGYLVTAPPPAPSPAPPRGRRQRRVLTRLLALGGAGWPVPLKRLWQGQRPSPADRAALSRAVRVLEGRGLLRRSHAGAASDGSSVRRASRLQLTPAGAALAQALTTPEER